MIRTFLRFLGILGTPLGHPRGNSSISTSILHQPPTSNQPCFVESNKFLQGVSYCVFSLLDTYIFLFSSKYTFEQIKTTNSNFLKKKSGFVDSYIQDWVFDIMNNLQMVEVSSQCNVRFTSFQVSRLLSTNLGTNVKRK